MTKNQNLYPRCHTGISEIGRYRYHATTLVGRHKFNFNTTSDNYK